MPPCRGILRAAEDYFLAKADYDLLFLDVELKGLDSSMNGMEMAKRIRGNGRAAPDGRLGENQKGAGKEQRGETHLTKDIPSNLNKESFVPCFGRAFFVYSRCIQMSGFML